jgi:hypothetical protein
VLREAGFRLSGGRLVPPAGPDAATAPAARDELSER